MTVNELAAAVQSATGRERRARLLDLWESVKGILYMKSRRFYGRYKDMCTRCGAELADLDGILWQVMLDALAAWTEDSGNMFTTFLDYPFKTRVAEALNLRTERGRRDPLNNCDSLDRELDGGDGDGTALAELVGDPDAAFLDDLLEGMDTEREAVVVHEAVERLPDPLREIITGYYFEGRTLAELAAARGVSLEAIRYRQRKALARLRNDKQLLLVCADRVANAKAAAAASKGIDRAAALLAVYDSTRAELERLTRACDLEAIRAKPADGSDAPEFVDGLAGLLAGYLTPHAPCTT